MIVKEEIWWDISNLFKMKKVLKWKIGPIQKNGLLVHNFFLAMLIFKSKL